MATAKKLPSGNWRCQVFVGTDANGKAIRKSVTAKTKTEALEKAKKIELTEKKNFSRLEKEMTIGSAVDRYIVQKEKASSLGRISPATVHGYQSIRDHQIQDIENTPVFRITDDLLQTWIDTLAKNHSAKTVKNAWSLVRASLWEVLPHSTVVDLRIELPTIGKRKVFVPTEADIKALLDYCKENDFEFFKAVLLSAFGTLRRSEVCALMADDVEGQTIHVHSACVYDKEMNLICKGTKTAMSDRYVTMPQFVIDTLPKEGRLVDITPNGISSRMRKNLNKINVPHFRFHDLRHYSASIMHQLGASNEIIMHRGGWSNDATLNAHYRGTMSEYEAQVTANLNNHFTELFG